MIGIIIAMQQEMLPYKDTIKSKQKIYGKDFYLCEIEGKEIVMSLSGIGKVNAAFCATIMIERFDVDLIISTGVSGGLGRTRPLDIVVAKNVVQHDVDTTALGDPKGMVSTVEKIFFDTSKKHSLVLKDNINNSKYGTIACGDQFIADKDKSNQIAKDFGAIACDMESGAIAQIAYIAGVDFVIVRGISDGADEDATKSFFDILEKTSNIIYNALKKAIKEI